MGKFQIDLEKFNQKIDGNLFRECPLCHHEGTIHCESDLMQINEFKSGEGSNLMSVVPLVVLTCNHCGNTILLNALVLDLVDRSEFIGDVTDGTKLE